MLPLIRSFATEFTGFPDGSPAGLPVSGEPGNRFAGLLNQSVAGRLPASQGLPDGHVLPPDGSILPSDLAGVADIDGGEFPLIEVDWPVGEFFDPDHDPQPIGSTAFETNLYGLGLDLESGPIGDAIAGELSGDSRRQQTGIESTIDRLAEITTGNGIELSPMQIGGRADSAVPVTAPPSGLAIEQRLIDRNGPIANAGLSSAELLSKGTVPAAQSVLPVTVVEQPGLAAASMQAAPTAAFELNKTASQVLEGATGRPTGGAADGPSSSSHTSLAGNPAIAATAALSSPAGTAAGVAGGTPTLHIGTPLQDGAWSNELGHRVLLMSGQQLQSAKIQISPAELGPITVNLVVDDGSAELTFQTHHALTRDAIEQALPRLREMLSENGLTLGNASVSDQGVRKDSFGHDSDGAGQAEPFADETTGLEGSREIQPGRILKGLLDTFV